ncbi:MAG TPA: ABC transporter ATP-binding protein [Candidatus Limnocylindria bacterium]|nr:ABC transporter ATP-binding protein [Candidatus Limnocylindria bacterium]
MTPKLAIDGLRVAYRADGRETLAVDGATLHVADGEFVAIVGPSGCGKSTILKVVAGLIPPSGGDVRVDGKPLDGVPDGVGMVFQHDALLPWKTVRDNVRLPLALRGLPHAEQNAEVDRLLTLVRLGGFADYFPRALSGGMRKRVALARTLAYNPSLFLMDEPFGPLDAQTRIHIGREFLDIWQRVGKSVVFITHDVEEAIALADRVLVMTARPGRVKAAFAIDLPRPRAFEEVRFTPRFRDLQAEIWHALTGDAPAELVS